MKYHTTYKSDFPIAITPHVPSAMLSSSCRTIQADILIKTKRRDNSVFRNHNVAFSENIVILYKHFTRGIAITIITTPIIQLYTIQYWPTCHLWYKIVINYTKETSTYCTTETRYHPYPFSTTLKCYKGDYTFHCRYTIPTVTIMPY